MNPCPAVYLLYVKGFFSKFWKLLDSVTSGNLTEKLLIDIKIIVLTLLLMLPLRSLALHAVVGRFRILLLHKTALISQNIAPCHWEIALILNALRNCNSRGYDADFSSFGVGADVHLHFPWHITVRRILVASPSVTLIFTLRFCGNLPSSVIHFSILMDAFSHKQATSDINLNIKKWVLV